jgi:hypothetical protein
MLIDIIMAIITLWLIASTVSIFIPETPARDGLYDAVFTYTDSTSEIIAITEAQAADLSVFTTMYDPKTGETKTVKSVEVVDGRL